MARDHPINWAADYRFTSALPAPVLKHLAPILQEALDRPPGSDSRCDAAAVSAIPATTRPRRVLAGGDVPAGKALDTAPVPATAQPDALAPE